MAHETHGIDTAVENIYPRPQQTLARVNISSLGVHSSLSYDPCAKPLAFHPRSSMHRATEILLLVMLPPVQPQEGMGNISRSQPPDHRLRLPL